MFCKKDRGAYSYLSCYRVWTCKQSQETINKVMVTLHFANYIRYVKIKVNNQKLVAES